MIGFRLFHPRAALAAVALLASACTPPTRTGPEPAPSPAPAPPPAEAPVYVPLTAGLPPIPSVEGPLAIRLVAPEAGQTLPSRDSTFLYGSVGTGGATLSINGVPVPVAPNGAFLAYLPVPADGTWRLQAARGAEHALHVYTYRPRPGGRPTRADTATEVEADTTAAHRALAASSVLFPVPRQGTVIRGSDTLATGSDAVYARPTPTGPYRWFFPRGTALRLVERRGGQYQVRLDSTTSAWIDTANVRAIRPPQPDIAAPIPAIGARSVSAGAAPEIRIAAGFAPFLVEADSAGVHVTVYGSAGGGALRVATDEFVTGAREEVRAGVLRVHVALSRWLWGYRASYDGNGTLVVRIRRPPAIDPASPLRGIRIVVDPGHPPAGAIGPTGFHEKDANLAIGLRLAERLRAAGADVRLTRDADVVVDLAARPAMAVAMDADLLVSVHNNAFGTEANPARDHGTSTYYFHSLSADLARTLDRRIAEATGIPDLGPKFGNLALVRPTWLPSVLTESLFMPIPEQEAALRDPGFLDRLADAHVRGIEDFLRIRAAGR